MLALGMETCGSPFSPEDTVVLRLSWNKHAAGEGRGEFMTFPHRRCDAFAQRQSALGLSSRRGSHPLVLKQPSKGS